MHHIKKNWSYLLIINCMDHIVCILTLKCWFFNTHTHYSRILPSGFQKKIYGYFNRWIGLASTILFLFAFVSLMHLYARYIFFVISFIGVFISPLKSLFQHGHILLRIIYLFDHLFHEYVGRFFLLCLSDTRRI